jgi:hypothetical protein
MTGNQTVELSNNTTNSSGSGLSLKVHDDWFYLRFLEGLIDAVWQQRQSTSPSRYFFQRLDGIIAYCCSFYGVSCLVMALILNRTLVIASTNSTRNQQAQLYQARGIMIKSRLTQLFKKFSMALFRILAIVLLMYNGYYVLVALNLHGHIGINCHTSIPWFYKLIPDSIFGYDPEYFSNNKYLATPNNQVMIGPTSDMYWPIFINFCLSSFVETFHAVILGRKPYTESGITIFEHSLAFQEFSSNRAFFFGNSNYHERPNEQVLISTLFLILTHLNIHIGGLINNNEYRLIPSTILGFSFLSYFVSSMFNYKIFGFPSILILTFIPQVLVLAIISISCIIFVLAVIANGFQTQDLNYASFLSHENSEDEMDYSIHRANIHLNDDFYTAMLNLVMLSITSAGKSSYITELSIVTMDDETWIERSLWENLKGSIGVSFENDSNGKANVIEYLKQNNINGYDNLISKPSQHLISGSIADRNESSGFENSSIIIKRFKYLRSMFINFFQLVVALANSGIIKVSNFFSSKNVEIESRNESSEQFEQRKAKVPPFLSKYVRRRIEGQFSSKKSNKIDMINLNDYSIDEIELKYDQFLLGKDIVEIDDSSDYINPEESENESDVEFEEESPINELITASNFKEILMASSNSILQHHMSSEYTLTRSRYRKIINHESEQDKQTYDLIQMIISKRLQKKSSSSTDDDGNFKLDCVICQVNTREIITWPCKCFAICESCRLTLVSKGMEGCVCCRRNVEGVSKVFIP